MLKKNQKKVSKIFRKGGEKQKTQKKLKKNLQNSLKKSNKMIKRSNKKMSLQISLLSNMHYRFSFIMKLNNLFMAKMQKIKCKQSQICIKLDHLNKGQNMPFMQKRQNIKDSNQSLQSIVQVGMSLQRLNFQKVIPVMNPQISEFFYTKIRIFFSIFYLMFNNTITSFLNSCNQIIQLILKQFKFLFLCDIFLYQNIYSKIYMDQRSEASQTESITLKQIIKSRPVAQKIKKSQNKGVSSCWSDNDLNQLNKLISVFGTDFEIIAKLLKTKSRKSIMNKYKKNKTTTNIIYRQKFLRLLKKINENGQQRARLDSISSIEQEDINMAVEVQALLNQK
ncbi:hypothetical protein pb186bvf_017051 [Paramecium bursaria]